MPSHYYGKDISIRDESKDDSKDVSLDQYRGFFSKVEAGIRLMLAFGIERSHKRKEKFISATVSIEEAQERLTELIEKMGPGEEVVITRDKQPVAKLIAQRETARRPRKPGSAKGKLTVLAEDDEHLNDFREYMP